MLAEGSCERCGHSYLVDLPSGHGLVYPAALDLNTGGTLDPGEAEWFSSWLQQAWDQPDTQPVGLTVENRNTNPKTGSGDAVLVNTLDRIYGHSVLKLLGAQRELEGAHDVILLISRALAELVPSGVAEVWIVEEPISRLAGWLSDLDRRLAGELDRLGSCLLSPVPPHPHCSIYAIERFVPGIEPARNGDPSVVLSLREDRTWGGGRNQLHNANELADTLQDAYPDIGIAAIGLGAPGGLSEWILDLRNPSSNGEHERRWLGLMRGADLAIGVHGSNLLLPSALAAATVELVPESRYGDLFQATLLAEHDPVLALNNHRTLYGDAELTDLTPQRVGEVAIALLDGHQRFEAMMTGPLARGESAGPEALPGKPPREAHPEGAPQRGGRGLLRRLRGLSRA